MESLGMSADSIGGRRPGPSSLSADLHSSSADHDSHGRSTTSTPTAGHSVSGSSSQLLSHPARSGAFDLDDTSSVGSNDALYHRVQLKSGLSSPRSSVSGSGPARRGAWRAMGGGKSSRSYAPTPKSSSDLSPSSSGQGREGTREGSPVACDAFELEVDGLATGDGSGDEQGEGDLDVKGQLPSHPAWDRLRQSGLAPPGGISYLPALSQSTAPTEESASNSTEPKSASTPNSSADAVPSVKQIELQTQPTGAYDWANFVYAYSRGRWHPGAIPQPPDQSTIHIGASVKISSPSLEGADAEAAANGPSQPRRPSLQYIMPLSSENVEAVSSSLLPPLEPSSLPKDQHWSDDGILAASSKISPPDPSEFSAESLPERSNMLSLGTLSSMSSSDLARQQQTQLYAAMHDPSSSTSAVVQLPSSKPLDRKSVSDGPSDAAPLRAQTAPQSQFLTKPTERTSPKREPLQPDPSVWQTPKVAPREPAKHGAAETMKVKQAVVGSETRQTGGDASQVTPGFAAQVSQLQLEHGISPRGSRQGSADAGSHQEQERTEELKHRADDPKTPTRPGPTPVQTSGSDGHDVETWQSAPDGLSGLAEALSRRTSANVPAETAAYSGDLGPEHGTVAGLRRAARRTSIERGEGNDRRPTAEHLRKGHSASFPGTSRGSPLATGAGDGLPIVPHLSSIGNPNVSGTTGSSPSSGGGHSNGPATSGDSSSVISVAHFIQGKPTGETRIDLRGNVSSPPSMTMALANEGPEGSSQLRKQNSVATASRVRPHLGAKTTSQRINAYLAAGRRAEKFYNDNGYLPFVAPPNESSRLQALSRYGPPKIAGDPNFERISHLVKLVFNSKLVLITLVGADEQMIQAEMGGGGEVTVASLQSVAGSRNCSFCSHAILQDSDEPMVILDAAKDWRFAGNPLVQSSPDIRFYAGCPLRTPDGQNIGSLCLIDDKPRTEFGPRQRHTLKEFARVVMREMELLRDKIHLGMRDRMQKSIELFTKDCLEMDSEESEPESSTTSAGTHKVFDQAAESIRTALRVSGAVIFDLSHFELIDTYDSDLASGDLAGVSTGTKVYFSNPVRPSLASSERGDGDDTPGTKSHRRNHSAGIDGTSGFETFSPLSSPTQEGVRGKVVPPMSVLGASESVPAPAERMDSVPLAHHIKVAEFLRLNKTGRFYPFAPPPFRALLPSGVTNLLLVPIFGLNKQPFALLCAYSTVSADGPALEEVKSIGLQYLRAIGMIVLSAVLKKDIMLADKAKSHFISNISHELRTPLHGILAAAELLAETKLNATQGSYLETVEACGKSLLELVNHVLDFTKLSGNSRQGQKQIYTKTKCDMVKLVQEVCESSWIGQMAKQLDSAHSGIGSVYAPPKAEGQSISNVQARAKHAQSSQVETVIDISLRPDGWLVNCDTGGIRRVLMNLIGNSLKFTVSGYVHVSLREVHSSDTHVLIELGVIDTGRGISRAFLEEQLFHPFTQENPHGTGTGLGLSIVNSIVQSPALNGKIDVWSTEGQGTEIRVTCELELCDDEDAEGPIYRPAVNVRKRKSVALLGFGNSRGDEDLRSALEGYFYNWWEFAIVEQDDAVKVRYGDLVLINDDLTVLGRIRRDRSGNLPPVIFLTAGRGDSEIAASCDEYHAAGGVARILFKPAGPSKLESVVDFCLQCLDRQRSGDPPSNEETKPSTPLPSPSQSPAARSNVENGDTYFFPAQARPETRPSLGQGFDSFETNMSELTPKAETMAMNSADADRLAAPESYHMSPGPPGPSTSLIRRHSTEDKVVRQKMEGTDTCPDTGATGCSKPSRPLLPARSITYHEPRLHKHVLMSPLAGPSPKRLDGESGTYFDHSPSTSSPNTPGSTISLEGGDGAVLRSVVSSTTTRSISGSHKRRLQILSVEDNAINRKVIAAFLSKLEVDFVEACNGDEGVKQFEAHPPNHFDVILMDLSMPVLDGLSATAAIRKIESERYARSLEAATPANAAPPDITSKLGGHSKGQPVRPTARNRVKIFALTGRSTDEDKRRAFQTGADGYIVKPLSFKVLSSLLRMLPR